MPHRIGLLRLLTPEQRERLQLKPASFRRGETLFERGKPIREFHVLNGLISAYSTLADGKDTGVFIFGGQWGLFIGGHTMWRRPQSLYDFVCETDASGWRAPVRAIENLAARDPGFRELLLRMLYVMDISVVETIGCCLKHTVIERLCRTLQSVQAILDSDTVPFNGPGLAKIVGCDHRVLSPALNRLAADRLIERGKGQLEILDLGGIAERSCSCFDSFRRQRERFYARQRIKI